MLKAVPVLGSQDQEAGRSFRNLREKRTGELRYLNNNPVYFLFTFQRLL